MLDVLLLVMLVTKKSTLKSYILENLSQIEIFAKMLGVLESEIETCLSGEPILNSIRGERTPSVHMRYVQDKSTNRTKIQMRDFGDRRYSGDCFDIMGIILGVDATDNKGFVQVCKAILNLQTYKKFLSESDVKITPKGIIDISFIPRPWLYEDEKWCTAFGLTPNAMETIVKCYPVEIAYIGKATPSYNYRVNDPCYAYLIGRYRNTNLIKLYFPKRKRGGKYPRFITNNPFPFDDLTPFKKYDVLVLTKSLKDKAVLVNELFHTKAFIKIFNEGVTLDVRSVSSETDNITEVQARLLQGMYGMIVTCFDFDRQGCYTSALYRRQYGFIPMMLTNGKFNSTFNYGAKDITEYRTNFGDNTLSLLEDAIYALTIHYEKLTAYR